MVRPPQDFAIHPSFTLYGNEEEIRAAFLQINSLFMQIFADIAEMPADFGMPLFPKEQYPYFSQQSRESEQAALRPFILLHQLLTCGEIVGDSVVVPADWLGEVSSRPRPHPNLVAVHNRKVAKAHILVEKLPDYGFIFDGLKNNKTDITVSYPDNPLVLYLLKMLADKSLDRFGDFISCSYRLLDDMANYSRLEHMVDKLHDEAEKEFVCKLDRALVAEGLTRDWGGNDEGPGLAYFRGGSKVSSFRIAADGFGIINFTAGAKKLELGLRIRNVAKCMEYLESCPTSVRQIFTKDSDEGCAKRRGNTCKHSVSYEIEGKQYWRCACCSMPFNCEPNSDDIPYYIKLVELGEKK